MIFTEAITISDKEKSFHCLYKGYYNSGFIPYNKNERYSTHYQEVEGNKIFIAEEDNVTYGTISLFIDKNYPIPIRTIFNDEVNKFTNLAEAGHLSICEIPPNSIYIINNLIKIVAIEAIKNHINHVVIAVHPRHAPLYMRFVNFIPFTKEKAYPFVQDKLAVGLILNIDEVKKNRPDIYQKYIG